MDTPPARAQPCRQPGGHRYRLLVWTLGETASQRRASSQPRPSTISSSRTSKRSVGSWCSSTRRGRRADRAETAPDRLTFVAMAVHALRVGRQSVWSLCQTAAGPAAPDRPERCRRRGRRVLLNAHEYGTDPERRAAPHRRPASRLPSPTMPASSNSPGVLGQDGWHGDPFLAVKLQYPEWTRALGPGRRRA